MATPPEPTAATDSNAQQVRISTTNAQTTYVNFCRGTLTPEEIVLDLGFNANGFGVKVLEEDLEIRQRIILSPGTAKRMLFQLNEMVRRHEQNFGEVEMDFRRRSKPRPTARLRSPDRPGGSQSFSLGQAIPPRRLNGRRGRAVKVLAPD